MHDSRHEARRALLCPTRLHPLQDFLLTLPRVAVTPSGQIDYASSDPAVLRELGEHAKDCMRLSHEGIEAIGSLLAYLAPEMDVGEIPGEAVEAMGHLIRALGTLMAQGLVISTACTEQLGSDGGPIS